MFRRVLIGWIVAAMVCLPVSGAKLPRPAGDFSFELPGGEMVNLSKYKGKVIALEFLLTTCPHCQRTSKVMQQLYSEYGPKGFQSVGVAFNDANLEMVKAYAVQSGATYPVGLGDRDKVVDFLQHPIMLTLWTPILVMIDKSGNIRGQYQGTDQFFKNEEANMRKTIEELLAE
jgi:thiol-disulfide isomerase/thioredoxin